MNAEDILQTVLDTLSTVGSKTAEICSHLFGQLSVAVSSWLSTLTFPMLPTILKVFSNKTINLALFWGVLLFIIILNIAAFMMFGIDKKRSKIRRKKRISEKALMRICFFGGAAGGVLGMQIFKHKTEHRKFVIFVPLLFIIQLILDSILFGFLGFWAFF